MSGPAESTPPTCASCRQELSDRSRSWVFLRIISGAITTIWLCEGCQPESLERCAVCSVKQPLSRIPLCADCLFEYENATGQPVGLERRRKAGPGAA